MLQNERMLELLLFNSLQFDLRDPYKEDFEIKFVKEPENVLGNPFKIVERLKSVKVLAEEDFLEDQENPKNSKNYNKII